MTPHALESNSVALAGGSTGIVILVRLACLFLEKRSYAMRMSAVGLMVLAGSFAAHEALADPQLRLVVRGTDAELDRLSRTNPTINDGGLVAYRNSINIYAERSGSLSRIAWIGGTPASVPGATFQSLGVPQYINIGDVFYSGTTNTGGIEGIWRSSSGGLEELIVLDGDVSPIDPAHSFEFTPQFGVVPTLQDFWITDTGGLFFYGTTTSPNPTAMNPNGVSQEDIGFWSSSSSSSLSKEVIIGDTAPFDASLLIDFPGPYTFSQFQNADMNSAGDYLVTGTCTSLSGNGTFLGLWTSELGSSTATLVALSQAAVPTIANAVYQGTGEIDIDLGLPKINDSGEIAFGATITNDRDVMNGPITSGENDQVIYRYDPLGPYTLIAQSNQTAPGSGGDVFRSLNSQSVQINNDGLVAFRASVNDLANTFGTRRQAIYAGDGGIPQPAVLQFDQAPDLATGIEIFQITEYVLGDDGHVIFRCTLCNPSDPLSIDSSNDVALYKWDSSSQTTTLILRTGDTIDVPDGSVCGNTSTLTGIQFAEDAPDQLGSEFVSSGGEILVVLGFRDGATNLLDTGVFVVSEGSTCVGDFDNDFDVDLGDFGAFGSAFGSSIGDLNYLPCADFNNDGDIDLGDFGVFGAEFGNTAIDCMP